MHDHGNYSGCGPGSCPDWPTLPEFNDAARIAADDGSSLSDAALTEPISEGWCPVSVYIPARVRIRLLVPFGQVSLLTAEVGR